ncbi:MAG: hypothetical protein ABI876_18750, partial [Bacteroidota bacterium]
TVIRRAMNFLDTPGGVAQAQAFRAALESQDSELLSTELATGILGSDELGLVGDSRLQGLQGIGIGMSLGVSFKIRVGLLAGIDLVFDTQDSNAQRREWVGATTASVRSASIGLELSFWFNNKPLTGTIMGLYLDVYIPLENNPILFYFRILYIRERPQAGTRFISSAVTIQFPIGVVSPIGTKSLQFGAFVAKQWAHQRSKRSTLDVINESTGQATISVEETTTLKVTFKNTSVYDYYLNPGSTLTIGLPAYFSDDDIDNMSIDSSGWTLTYGSGKLILTLDEGYMWGSDSALTFEITNVSSSNTPPSSAQSWPGQINATLNSNVSTVPIAATAEFDLIWASSQATLSWNASLNSEYFTFTDGAPTGGNGVSATADPGSTVVTLTTAQQVGTDDVWVLGYVYNYNTALPDDPQPQIAAVWWKQDAVKTSSNLYTGNVVTPDSTDLTTECYYGNLENSGCLISIDVVFNS